MRDQGNEIAEIGELLDGERRERHAVWKIENTAAMFESGIMFRSANNGEALLVREPGYPSCDFYPSTGRWRVAGVKRTYGGGAEAFINWYRTQATCQLRAAC